MSHYNTECCGLPCPGAEPQTGTQKFFATLAAESRKPSFGDQSREFLRNLLLRAQEASLYRPEKP